MESQEIWLQVPKSLRTIKGEIYLLNSYFHIFVSHQFLHHWAWKHYLGPEVVKVIDSYFEFYKNLVWNCMNSEISPFSDHLEKSAYAWSPEVR